jgi:hypothetical protein
LTHAVPGVIQQFEEEIPKNWIDWDGKGRVQLPDSCVAFTATHCGDLTAYIFYCPVWRERMSNFTQAFGRILEGDKGVTNYNLVKKLQPLMRTYDQVPSLFCGDKHLDKEFLVRFGLKKTLIALSSILMTTTVLCLSYPIWR